MELGTERAVGSGHHQGVHRKLPCFVMYDQFEPVGQERPHHLEQRFGWTAGCKGRKTSFGLREDIEAFCSYPIGPAHESEGRGRRNPIGKRDESLNRKVRGGEAAARWRLNTLSLVA